jgi:hypothetical protein
MVVCYRGWRANITMAADNWGDQGRARLGAFMKIATSTTRAQVPPTCYTIPNSHATLTPYHLLHG